MVKSPRGLLIAQANEGGGGGGKTPRHARLARRSIHLLEAMKKSCGCEGRSTRTDRVLEEEKDSWIGRATVAMAM